jgi:hypothetical protein
MAAKNQRNVDIQWLNSGTDTSSIEYNPAAGAQKTLSVGPRLIPINIGLNSWTTNATTARYLQPGTTLYVYNNAATAGTVNVGTSNAITSLALGVVDANGNVGIACAPNAYTPISMGLNQWIIASAATLFVYLVEDPTHFIQQTPQLVPQNVPGFVPPVSS